MAYIRKDKGKWRAEVAVLGHRASKSFDTKAAATQWAAAEETILRAGTRDKFPAKSLGQALAKYELEISKHKRGGPLEVKRMAALAADFPELCAKVISEITTTDLAGWRDARLKKVTKGSVQRDVNLLRNVWTVAADEWKWCEAPGPWKGFRAPGENPARTRRVSRAEIKHALRWAAFRSGQLPHTKTCEAAWAFLLGLRTAMRAGEMLSLTVNDVDLTSRVVTLHKHKTVEIVGARHIPVTKQAGRVLAALCALARREGRLTLFSLSAPQLDAIWRKHTRMCNIKDLHFHDSRGEALTLLSRKVDPLTLARISGHRDLNILLNTYYRERPEQIAARL